MRSAAGTRSAGHGNGWAWSASSSAPTTSSTSRRSGRTTATALLQVLPEEQRTAISAHVLGDVAYRDIAAAQHVSEAVVRKRVSRGLAVIRERMGGKR